MTFDDPNSLFLSSDLYWLSQFDFLCSFPVINVEILNTRYFLISAVETDTWFELSFYTMLILGNCFLLVTIGLLQLAF